MTTAIILSIGDELVLGQTLDTNSAWLSQQLAAIGVRVLAHATVSDDQAAIEEAIRSCAARCDVLLISGGLGPTEDDLTRQALAAVLSVSLEMNHAALEALTAFFRRLNREMPESNKIQAMVPRGAQMIENTCGTAPGISAELQISNLKSHIFVVPGVPHEMKTMFTRDILPRLRQLGGGAVVLSRTLHTFGVGESTIGQLLGELMQRGRNPSVGTTVAGGVVSVRINSYFESRQRALEELEKTTAACREKLGNLIYGQDEQTLAQVVAMQLATDAAAAQHAPALATVESCTGGLLAKMLTDVPGSSKYFRQGWVTYDNEAKTNEVNVPQEIIQHHGAVSEPVVRAMAQGGNQQAGTYYTLAITGVAGPDGGTPEKPVGTVWIALAAGKETTARKFIFSGDREFIRDRSAKMALTMLRFHFLGKPLPF